MTETAATPSITKLQEALRKADQPKPVETHRAMQRQLDRDRIAVSHSNRQREDLELQREELERTRAALVDRHNRIGAEIHDIDRAMRAIDAGISTLMVDA
jgi:chromosome segregation ATPase